MGETRVVFFFPFHPHSLSACGLCQSQGNSWTEQQALGTGGNSEHKHSVGAKRRRDGGDHQARGKVYSTEVERPSARCMQVWEAQVRWRSWNSRTQHLFPCLRPAHQGEEEEEEENSCQEPPQGQSAAAKGDAGETENFGQAAHRCQLPRGWSPLLPGDRQVSSSSTSVSSSQVWAEDLDTMASPSGSVVYYFLSKLQSHAVWALTRQENSPF